MSPLRMAKARAVRPPRVPEKVEQQHIVTLARIVGCVVIVLGTVRRGSRCPRCGTFVQGHMGTQQTAGVADLEIWLPPRGSTIANRWELLKWETKADDGRLSPEQIVYRRLCVDGGVTWGFGTFADFEQLCVARGLVKAENVPHDRHPKEPV